jgi:hypothetical protein
LTESRDLIFWREGRNFAAMLSAPLTECIQLRGKSLKMTGSLGDYDLLRSQGNELVGAAFSLTQRDLEFIEPLVSGSDAVVVNLPDVHFYLSACADPKIQTVQGSSWIYCEGSRPVAIGIHKWIDWGSIGFKLVEG